MGVSASGHCGAGVTVPSHVKLYSQNHPQAHTVPDNLLCVSSNQFPCQFEDIFEVFNTLEEGRLLPFFHIKIPLQAMGAIEGACILGF